MKDLVTLAREIAISDGDFATGIPGVTVYRRSTPSEPIPCIYGLGLGVTLQGKKRIVLGDDSYSCESGQSLITAMTLPVVSYVAPKSDSEPYLGLRIEWSTKELQQVVNSAASTKHTCCRALAVLTMDRYLNNALSRLLELEAQRDVKELIAPIIQKEIMIRLLSGAHGNILRQLVSEGTPNKEIANVISWLKVNYARSITMTDLASMAHMSESTFRQHFRAVTGISPLKYLKQLRLQEAKSMMLDNDLDASTVAYTVGYNSATQFSREYRRFFGYPPLQDKLRAQKAF